MTDKDFGEMCSFVSGCIITAIVSGLFILASGTTGRWELEDASVEAGHAEYYLNEEHEREWRWLDHSESE